MPKGISKNNRKSLIVNNNDIKNKDLHNKDTEFFKNKNEMAIYKINDLLFFLEENKKELSQHSSLLQFLKFNNNTNKQSNFGFVTITKNKKKKHNPSGCCG